MSFINVLDDSVTPESLSRLTEEFSKKSANPELVYTDHNGLVVVGYEIDNPKGEKVRGHLYRTGVPERPPLSTLVFQNGPVPDVGVNGVTNETVIAVVVHRLEVLNTKFPCKENENAINYLKDALQELEDRTRNRQKRGVEGKEVL